MVTPLVHMGLGYDDLLVPALVHAGFETKDLVSKPACTRAGTRRSS